MDDVNSEVARLARLAKLDNDAQTGIVAAQIREAKEQMGALKDMENTDKALMAWQEQLSAVDPSNSLEKNIQTYKQAGREARRILNKEYGSRHNPQSDKDNRARHARMQSLKDGSWVLPQSTARPARRSRKRKRGSEEESASGSRSASNGPGSKSASGSASGSESWFESESESDSESGVVSGQEKPVIERHNDDTLYPSENHLVRKYKRYWYKEKKLDKKTQPMSYRTFTRAFVRDRVRWRTYDTNVKRLAQDVGKASGVPPSMLLRDDGNAYAAATPTSRAVYIVDGVGGAPPETSTRDTLRVPVLVETYDAGTGTGPGATALLLVGDAANYTGMDATSFLVNSLVSCTAKRCNPELRSHCVLGESAAERAAIILAAAPGGNEYERKGAMSLRSGTPRLVSLVCMDYVVDIDVARYNHHKRRAQALDSKSGKRDNPDGDDATSSRDNESL